VLCELIVHPGLEMDGDELGFHVISTDFPVSAERSPASSTSISFMPS
jgi:hypothetical protein